jgi:AmmeMemoRadiSam system protein B
VNLDFMPSPLPDRPGLLIRDPFQYSETTLIIPRALIPCLQCFDGQHTDLDLRAALVEITGDLRISEIEQQIVGSLRQAGFLEDDVFAAMRDSRQKSFAEHLTREPAHAGSAYPVEREALQETLRRYMDQAAQPPGEIAGIAAPHVSPEGGRQSYRAAYSALRADCRDRVFVILGTSHYGEPERFGLTRKPFVTPLGEARADANLVDRLAAEGGAAVKMEDYCHAVEHSIEFQVVFLQHLCGPDIRIVPILCGPFAHSLYNGGKPEHDENVKRFLGALGEMACREDRRMVWVLGVDMAHMGRRYGDSFSATADHGEMEAVAEADRARIRCIAEGDADAFWDEVKENHDPLKWCGSSPFYTFLKAVPGSRGELLSYEQWNIDPASVVSFGAMAFRA